MQSYILIFFLNVNEAPSSFQTKELYALFNQRCLNVECDDIDVLSYTEFHTDET